MAMTKAQGGSAAIADETGKLLGIFTDGDFRRIMATSQKECCPSRPVATTAGDLLNDPISAHMTRSPKFVYDTAYAVELLKIFEKMKIDDLPVCDAEGRIVGLVDIQDLPKMKVM